MLTRYYLAYGSNLNLEQMESRCGNVRVLGTVLLKDFRLVYKGGADEFAYLTIEPCKGACLPLGLYAVSLLGERALDRYEGYPSFYSKYYIPVQVNGRTIKALIYVMNEEFTYHLPSKEYVETCKQGYQDFSFPLSILEASLEDTKREIEKNSIKKSMRKR